MRFGGIQWTTNFATQPGFISFPMPGLRGEAALPSTVDVYLDNARMARGEVPAGPFDLADVPVITGQGELRMVVSDPLGRQQIVTQPYYASPQLLKPGLRDFSYEAGTVREDYGIASARYGRFMLAATDRLGLAPDFTRELRAEILAGQQTLGAGGVWLLPRLGGFYPGTLGFGAAVSHSQAGPGHLLSLGLERQARDFSFHLRAEHAARNFVQLGQSPGRSPRQTLTAGAGFSPGGNGLGLGYLRQSTWEGDDHRLLTASYSLHLGGAGQLGLFALRELSGDAGLSLSVVWVMALDQRTSLSADQSRQDGDSRTTLQMQRNLPAGEGFGYRLRAGDDEHYQAGATLQTERATFTAEAASFAGRDGYRVGVSGGVAVAGGGVFPSRRIDGSFAIIKVSDYAGVRVYRDNQEVTRTDERGLALVTRLRAYQENPVGIEQADLPLDAEVETLQLKLTPALRSGVVVDFPVRASRGAAFRLVGEDGAALPPGAVVRIEGLAQEFPVGYDGRAFVTGLAPDSRLLAEWGGRRCIVERIPGAVAGPLPELGTLVCTGASP